MALQSPFFNNTSKRDATDAQPQRPGATMVTPSSTATPPANVPAVTPPVAAQPSSQDVESKLTVGPNIKLKGVEITDCDTLLVEGSVEATMDSRVMQISERGSFKGSAEIDIAEIRGVFDGTLTVREKLVIHATGKVTGRVRYGKLVIEEGGQLSGDIEFGTSTTASRAPAAARAGLQPVQA